MSLLQKIRIVTALMVLLLLLSGCLLNRVVEVRDQFCEFDSNFELRFADQSGQDYPEINFLNPVLLDNDVLWMAGAAPTETRRTADGLSMIWIVDKVSALPEPDTEFRIIMNFNEFDDENKLSSIYFDPKLKVLMNPKFIDSESLLRGAENICSTGLGMNSTRMEIDISDQDLDELPSRQEMLEWLGAPLSWAEHENSYTYEFRLRNSNAVPQTARFTVWYDANGKKPLRMVSDYSRFSTSADFVSKKMQVRVSI